MDLKLNTLGCKIEHNFSQDGGSRPRGSKTEHNIIQDGRSR